MVTLQVGIFPTLADINTTYVPTLTLADLILPAGYTWNNLETSLNAGDGQQFPAAYIDPSGNYSTVSGNITVNVAKAVGVFPEHSVIIIIYQPTLTLANLHLEIGYNWDNPETILDIGDDQKFPSTFNHISGNYSTAYGEVKVNVLKSDPNFVTHPIINTTYTDGMTLASLNSKLENNYTWDYPTTHLYAGNDQLFLATYINPNNDNKPVRGDITVNVAKAVGVFHEHLVIYHTYQPALTLAIFHLETGYEWNNPETILNAGDGQKFHATYTDPSRNYTSASGEITVNIAKANGAAVIAPTSSVTINSITINAVPAPNDEQTIEYAINTINTPPIIGWQTELIFSGLSSGEIYYIFARSASNNNYNAGATVSTQIQVPSAEFEIDFGDPSEKLYLNNNLLQNGGTTIFNQSNEYFTINIASGSYMDVIWYINGNVAAQGTSRTSITLSRQVTGVYHVVVEATLTGNRKNSGNHYFIVQ